MYPVVFTWGSLTLPSYGLMAFLGFLVAYLGPYRRARHLGWDPALVTELALYSGVAALVGTRLLYVVTYPAAFRADPLSVFRFWEGGITYVGALGGAFVAGVWHLRRNRLPLGPVLDLFSPFLALAHGLGRIGCFLQGCCYGVPTTSEWGVVFPAAPGGAPRIPVQLAEAGVELATGVVLQVLWHRGVRDGRCTALWFATYGAARILLDGLRGDVPLERGAWGFTLGQASGLALLLAGLAAWRGLTRAGSPRT